MARKHNNPIARRNLILYAGLGMLTMAIFHKPSLLWFFLSIGGVFEVFLCGFVSLFAAMGFYECASLIFKNNRMPWYTKPGGIFLLIVLVIAFFLVRHVLNNVFFPVFVITPLVHIRAQLYAFWGMTFLWIVFLEKISCK